MTSTIGIKIANGEFYPILEENSSVKKRLILTTVHDRQDSVQIDLFRSVGKTMFDAQYIGSLVVENIKARLKGEPSIEMIISSNASGEITADAIDLDTKAGGQHNVLNVSLKSVDETNREMDIPDFELENNEEPPTGLYKKAMKIKEKKEKKFPWAIIIVIMVVLLLALLGVWLFLFGGKEAVSSLFSKGQEKVAEQPSPVYTPPPPVQTTPPVVQPQTPPPAEQPQAQTPPPAVQTPPVTQTPPVIVAPATPPERTAAAPRNRPPAPVMSYNVPATIPRNGAPYTIRWGDTLWDIAAAFYRNPWLYPRIARFNNIRNPDLIISGRTIRIPPRN